MIESWGGLATSGVEILGDKLENLLRDAVLSRGLGRAYGDAALPANPKDKVVSTRLANRILFFDPKNRVIEVEAGISYRELNRVVWRKNLAIPVSPGTEFVTIGGAVSADVHGKNHHSAGSFGDYVVSLRVVLASGDTIEISDSKEPELFRAVIGGMGLIAHIASVKFKLEEIPSPWIEAETFVGENLDEVIELLEKLRDFPFTAAWIDGCARNNGRGIVYVGRWSKKRIDIPKAPSTVSVPFRPPCSVLRNLSIELFNTVYFLAKSLSAKRTVVSPYSFYYPLDGVNNWNRLYGKKGFFQYQCVIPEDAGKNAVKELFKLIWKRGGLPYLVVLKDMGSRGKGILSFPIKGYTLALDFPFTKENIKLAYELDAFTIECGGRVYLAKDALLTKENFSKMYKDSIDRFQEIREKWNKDFKIRSKMGVRLFGDPK